MLNHPGPGGNSPPVTIDPELDSRRDEFIRGIAEKSTGSWRGPTLRESVEDAKPIVVLRGRSVWNPYTRAQNNSSGTGPNTASYALPARPRLGNAPQSMSVLSQGARAPRRERFPFRTHSWAGTWVARVQACSLNRARRKLPTCFIRTRRKSILAAKRVRKGGDGIAKTRHAVSSHKGIPWMGSTRNPSTSIEIPASGN